MGVKTPINHSGQTLTIFVRLFLVPLTNLFFVLFLEQQPVLHNTRQQFLEISQLSLFNQNFCLLNPHHSMLLARRKNKNFPILKNFA